MYNIFDTYVIFISSSNLEIRGESDYSNAFCCFDRFQQNGSVFTIN